MHSNQQGFRDPVHDFWESSFLGQTARSEYLFRVLSKAPPAPLVMPPRLSRRIIELAFPDSDVVDENLGREIFELLPPLSEAIRLCDTYLEHGSYLPMTLQRTELLDEVLEAVYRAGSFENLRNRHALSLLFVVFATAATLDANRHPHSIEAQEYYYLSRAALGLASPVRETTLSAIQALIHMAQYLDPIRLAHGIGIRLDWLAGRWNLSKEASERRGRLFWQLFLADTSLSFSLGRPSSMSTNYMDCSYPKEPPEVSRDDGGEKQMSYFLYTCKYSVLMHTIMASAFSAKVPAYTTVLDLDRKIRDFYPPPQIRPIYGPEMPPPTPHILMQRFLALSTKEGTLLNLHRAYFAQALQEKPDDLANHRYIPSVMAAYRSMWRLIHGLVIMWRDIPSLLARVGSAWSPALSAAIVMCILATRAAGSKMTKSSLEELDDLAKLFQEASATCRFAANLLTPIQVLMRKAHQAVDDNVNPHPDDCVLTPADLDRPGGKTHLISQLNDVTARRDSPSPPPEDNRTYMFSDMTTITSETMHPTIAQDIRSFDLGEPSQFYDTFPDADMAGIQFTNDSMFSAQPSGFGYSPPPAFQTPAVSFASGAPPMLDATRQSFVEQLGF
ncbi:hypothetical protein C8R43DRAFT_1118155 [Mycena crocata]|nr:hypothetical protein C8R43DRAFT_1118155 [Mycena crocata]